MAACRAELPTSAELQGMDASGAERRIASLVPAGASATYTVNGVAVSEAEAKAIPASRIASIDIRKVDRRTMEIRLITQSAEQGAKGAGPMTETVRIVEGTPGPTEKKKFDGLLLVNGVRTDPAQLDRIDPATILNVEVVKGPAAEQQYGAEGARGVIRITTKK